MTNDDEREWSDEEARALRALGSSAEGPPPHLKPRVMRALSALGVLSRPPGTMRPWIPWAAAVILGLGGFGLGRAGTSSPSSSAPGGTRYVLLLNGGRSATPEENQLRRKEYGEWLDGLRQRGLGVSGEEMVGEAVELPGPRPGSPVVGFFVITAANATEAVSIARTTPHLRHDGGVTVAALR